MPYPVTPFAAFFAALQGSRSRHLLDINRHTLYVYNSSYT
jgi:hypothetical protein